LVFALFFKSIFFWGGNEYRFALGLDLDLFFDQFFIGFTLFFNKASFDVKP